MDDDLGLNSDTGTLGVSGSKYVDPVKLQQIKFRLMELLQEQQGEEQRPRQPTPEESAELHAHAMQLLQTGATEEVSPPAQDEASAKEQPFPKTQETPSPDWNTGKGILSESKTEKLTSMPPQERPVQPTPPIGAPGGPGLPTSPAPSKDKYSDYPEVLRKNFENFDRQKAGKPLLDSAGFEHGPVSPESRKRILDILDKTKAGSEPMFSDPFASSPEKRAAFEKIKSAGDASEVRQAAHQLIDGIRKASFDFSRRTQEKQQIDDILKEPQGAATMPQGRPVPTKEQEPAALPTPPIGAPGGPGLPTSPAPQNGLPPKTQDFVQKEADQLSKGVQTFDQADNKLRAAYEDPELDQAIKEARQRLNEFQTKSRAPAIWEYIAYILAVASGANPWQAASAIKSFSGRAEIPAQEMEAQKEVYGLLSQKREGGREHERRQYEEGREDKRFNRQMELLKEREGGRQGERQQNDTLKILNSNLQNYRSLRAQDSQALSSESNPARKRQLMQNIEGYDRKIKTLQDMLGEPVFGAPNQGGKPQGYVSPSAERLLGLGGAGA